MVSIGCGESVMGEYPIGWCVVSAINSLSVAQYYIYQPSGYTPLSPITEVTIKVRFDGIDFPSVPNLSEKVLKRATKLRVNLKIDK